MGFIHSCAARKHLVLRSVACAAILFVIIFHGCSIDESKTVDPSTGEPHGRVTTSTGCKALTGSQPDSGMPSDLDCFEYSYVEPGTLLLHHINAGFNCCPETIYADIRIGDGTITIEEIEDGSMWCDCLCLFDVDYRIEDLSPGTYTISFIEPYLPDGDDPLACTITVETGSSGRYCVSRSGYPWGITIAPESVGSFVGHTGCTSMQADGTSDWPWGDECMSYTYGADSTLALVHINAVFNCCPGELSGKVDITADSIIITESESERSCRCDCPYDLEYEILHLPPGLYHILVIDISHGGYYEDLQFDVDLNVPVSGKYCEEG